MSQKVVLEPGTYRVTATAYSTSEDPAVCELVDVEGSLFVVGMPLNGTTYVGALDGSLLQVLTTTETEMSCIADPGSSVTVTGASLTFFENVVSVEPPAPLSE
jgi:hypothetical protein